MDAKKYRHFERILGKTVVTVVLIICGISCPFKRSLNNFTRSSVIP